MILAAAHEIPVADNSFDVAFSRHVLEHQPDFQPVLEEMIRISSKLATHIFFKKPSTTKKIDFDPKINLYHNIYSQQDINNYLKQHDKVERFQWQNVTSHENIIFIWLKQKSN